MKIKINYSLILFLLTLFACKKDSVSPTVANAELIPYLNGTWHLKNSSNGSINPTSPSTPLISDAVIWEINGMELTILLLEADIFANLSKGKHQIKIASGQVESQFLVVDGNGFGAIKVTEGRLILDTRNKPNEAVSHAPIYAFVKQE